MKRFLRERGRFFGQSLTEVAMVGAFGPTSSSVADALAERTIGAVPTGRPRRFLEVGAGTGAITRSIVARLEPSDRLDLNELNGPYAAFLREEFGEDPRIRVLEGDVNALEGDLVPPYDAIVASLPLLNMPPAAVEQVFERMLTELLAPGGPLAYYDYWGKELRCWLAIRPSERRRMSEVLAVTRRFREAHETERRVLPTIPPAHLHVLSAPLPGEG